MFCLLESEGAPFGVERRGARAHACCCSRSLQDEPKKKGSVVVRRWESESAVEEAEPSAPCRREQGGMAGPAGDGDAPSARRRLHPPLPPHTKPLPFWSNNNTCPSDVSTLTLDPLRPLRKRARAPLHARKSNWSI